MTHPRTVLVVSILAASMLLSCGDSSAPPPTQPTQPQVLSATIQASGNGTLVIHNPSLDPGFKLTLELPIQIQETAGGSAIWNFFRVVWLRNGVEIERAERGANAIRDEGFRDIGARSTTNAVLFIPYNNRPHGSDAIFSDDLRITLRFIDTNDGRNIEIVLSQSSFAGVTISPVPAVVGLRRP